MKAVLVYQAGIANVFQVVEMADMQLRCAKRLLQADFRSAEFFARGLKAAGWHVESAYCNQAGDIANSEWCVDLDDMPFRENASPVSSSQRV